MVPLGQVFRGRIIERDLALVDHVGENQSRERLAHRADLEQSIAVDLGAGARAVRHDALPLRPQHTDYDPLPGERCVALGDQLRDLSVRRQLPVGRDRPRRGHGGEPQFPLLPTLAPFALPRHPCSIPLRLVAATDARHGESKAARIGRYLRERQPHDALSWAVQGSAQGAGLVGRNMHDQRHARSGRGLEDPRPVAGGFLRGCGSGDRDS